MIVVATSQQKVNETVWLDELPDWPHRVYVAGDHDAPFHTQINKGNEANHYLTYIIENYDNLPDVVVFVHHHNTGPHDDDLLLSNVNAIRHLDPAHVIRNKYQSLRCDDDSNDQCNGDFIEWWNQANNDHWREVWAFAFGDEPCPRVAIAPCCAQFATSRNAIRARPRIVYERLHQWLVETERATYYTGRVFEYMWHIIFGMPAMYCPNRKKCYCEGFGICDTT